MEQDTPESWHKARKYVRQTNRRTEGRVFVYLYVPGTKSSQRDSSTQRGADVYLLCLENMTNRRTDVYLLTWYLFKVEICGSLIDLCSHSSFAVLESFVSAFLM